MKDLFTLALMSSVLLSIQVSAISAHAEVKQFPASADVITVVSQPAIDNFEIFSLAKARQAIDETQARVQAEIKAHNSVVMTQSAPLPSTSDAS